MAEVPRYLHNSILTVRLVGTPINGARSVLDKRSFPVRAGPHREKTPGGGAVTERSEGKGGEADLDGAGVRRHDRGGPGPSGVKLDIWLHPLAVSVRAIEAGWGVPAPDPPGASAQGGEGLSDRICSCFS
jgi:hypothetical protein